MAALRFHCPIGSQSSALRLSGLAGIRRKATDIYEVYETDERVLNDQTGHRSSDTRREVYQEKRREEVRARSAATRRRVRAAAFGLKFEDGGSEHQ